MSDEPDETSYYLRLMSMYMDLGTEIVLDVFIYHTPGNDAQTFLKSKQNMIIQLKNDHILNVQACSMLLQQGKNVVKCRLDIKSFDISLLITLSRNLFTAHELPPPIKGWNNPPRQSDMSVAADLLRLVKIRNVIVGHHPRARLPFWRFDDEWKNVSEILIRLQQHIAPGKEVHLQARIEAYRLQLLDPTVKNKYDAKLKQWHNEVTTLQDQVEELIKQLEGFGAYFNSKSDRFERYTKLLFKGGHFVLSAFLDKKIKDEDRDLDKMLLDDEDGVRNVITDKEQLDKLYPCNHPNPTDPIDTSSWTVSLLSSVILQLFNSTEDEGVKESIKEIGEAHRNYANATILALDANAFEDYWTDLNSRMKIVSYKLDKDTAQRYHQIVDECKKKIDEKEFKTYIEELKTQGTQIKSFTETFKDVLQRAKDFLQDMITSGISFKTAQVLELKMITLGTDEEMKTLAEETLMKVWNDALHKADQSTHFLDVKKEVDKIVNEIKKSKSVKNILVRAKCILLQIKCTSPREMLDMIEYFQSKHFHESIRNISIELGYFLDTAIDVHSVITVECLWRMYNQRDTTEHVEEEGLSLQMNVSSPAGMKHLTSLCSRGMISNCTNSIADALSKHRGGTIALKAIADMKDFKHVFDTDSSSSDSCSDYTSIESNEQDNNYPNPINAEDMDYISEGLTIKGRTYAEEEINKQIEGTTYALKTLKLTSNEKGNEYEPEKPTRGLEGENKETVDNAMEFQEAVESKKNKGNTDEKREEPDETLKEFDEGFKDIVRGTILDDKEEALKELQDFKDSVYHGTRPVGRQSQRYLSDERTKTLFIRADGERTFETIALLELCQSQTAVAQYLELTYDSLQYSPNIAREIISTSQFAKDSHEATFGYELFNIHLSDLLREIRSLFTTNGDLSDVLHHAKKVRDKTAQSKKRYITLQTYVRRNIQQVQQSICSEKVFGEDEHTFKVKMGILRGPISKDESASKYEIERSQNIFTPDATGMHQFKDVNEEKLHKWRKGLTDIYARKMKVKKTFLHKLRPGLALTGGIDFSVLGPVDCSELFSLIREKSELDLQHYADWIKKRNTDTKLHALIDHIIKQRRKYIDRLETIRKQEYNKGLECLKEVTCHLENIDTQLTRMMNFWSELADDIEFLFINVDIVHDILPVFPKHNPLRQEWKFVKKLFNEYQRENHWSAEQFYRFDITAEEEEDIKRQHQLIYEKETTQGRSENKCSELKSLISEKADKHSYLKSVIRDTGKHEHLKKDE